MVCRPKDLGGIGVQDIEVNNMGLLGKWILKLLTENGIWQSLLRKKYVGQNVLSEVSRKLGVLIF
jgi:hypothetical protein